VELNDSAKREIDFAAYVLTDWPIIHALTRTVDRGVKVRIYLDAKRLSEKAGSNARDAATDSVNSWRHIFKFHGAIVCAGHLLRRGLFPAHAPGGVIFRRFEADALVSGPHQFDEGFTRSHVDLESAAAQLDPEMLAQRLLVDLQSSAMSA
jgi:PLD-like domain